MTQLPPPINGTEAYLAAVHDRLGEILARLPEGQPKPQTPAAAPETVELREPGISQPETPAPREVPATALKEPAPVSTRNTRKRTTTKKGS